jgi:hypothetical protein
MTLSSGFFMYALGLCIYILTKLLDSQRAPDVFSLRTHIF